MLGWLALLEMNGLILAVSIPSMRFVHSYLSSEVISGQGSRIAEIISFQFINYLAEIYFFATLSSLRMNFAIRKTTQATIRK